MENIPHIVVGNDKNKKKQPLFPEPEVFNEKEKKIIRNVKKWGLIIGVLIIVFYATFRVLKGWLF